MSETSSSSSTRRLMAASFLAIFIWGSIDSLLGAILPDLIQRAHLTDRTAGHVSLFNGVGLVIASLAAGPIMDRAGKRKVFLPALLLIAFALAGLTRAVTFREIAALAFTLGLGGSLVVTAAQSLVSDINPAGRAAALNLLNFFFGLGAFVTPLVRAGLQHLGGLAGTLAIVAGVCVLVFGFDCTVAFPAPPGPQRHQAGSVLGEPLFWLPTLIVFLYVGVETSIWYWQVVYWTRRFAASVSSARVGVSLFALAIMSGRLLSQWVLKVISSKALLLFGTGGSLLGLAGMRLAPRFILSLCSLVLAGLFMAVVFPTAIGVVGGRFAEASGTPIGLAVTGGWLGAMVLRPAIGYVAQTHGLAAGYWIMILAAALMVLFDVALAISTPAARYQPRQDEAIVA